MLSLKAMGGVAKITVGSFQALQCIHPKSLFCLSLFIFLLHLLSILLGKCLVLLVFWSILECLQSFMGHFPGRSGFSEDVLVTAASFIWAVWPSGN